MSTLGLRPGLGLGGKTHSRDVAMVVIPPGELDSGEEAAPLAKGDGAKFVLGAI